jgi:predicted NBD/HSP70 family sugar kinase
MMRKWFCSCRDAQVEREDAFTIGIAVPGLVDVGHKIVLMAPNLDLRQISLASSLEENLHRPVFLINDVGARGIGEQRIGAGEKSNHMVYIYVSYGRGVLGTTAGAYGAAVFAKSCLSQK